MWYTMIHLKTTWWHHFIAEGGVIYNGDVIMHSCPICNMPQIYSHFSSYNFLGICMFVAMVIIYACYCSICVKLLKSECMSLEQSTSTWATCGRYTNNGTILLDPCVIIAYTYITFNLAICFSVGIACLTYESFSALVFTSLYMQGIISLQREE